MNLCLRTHGPGNFSKSLSFQFLTVSTKVSYGSFTFLFEICTFLQTAYLCTDLKLSVAQQAPSSAWLAQSGGNLQLQSDASDMARAANPTGSFSSSMSAASKLSRLPSQSDLLERLRTLGFEKIMKFQWILQLLFEAGSYYIVMKDTAQFDKPTPMAKLNPGLISQICT